MVGKRTSEEIRKQREDIVCNLKLTHWKNHQIAGYLGVPLSLVRGMVRRLKKEKRLPEHKLIGTRNPNMKV